MNTPSARCYCPKCRKLPNHPIQVLVNFNTEGICIRQSLPCTILRILLSRCLVSLTYRLAYLGKQMKSILCLKLFRTLIKTHVAS